MLRLGLDIGSKTVKLVVLGEDGAILHSTYKRHLSDVRETLLYTIANALPYFPDESFSVGVTGSAGMRAAELLGLSFTQEVVAVRTAIKTFIPETDVAIEIGGEDSKILFLTDGEELRMNSTCAGGTGGFIDTIAGMLDMNAEKLNFHAHGCRTIHPIASRCAVFAQADVRPLLNQGVSKSDIAGSVMDAVAVQCIAGLACGRPIRGTVAFLGGPLHFLSALRARFIERLGLDDAHAIAPADAHLFVACGAALEGDESARFTLEQLRAALEAADWQDGATLERLEPLFEDEAAYDEFRERHAQLRAPRTKLEGYEGRAFLGVDSGSEAIKYVLVAEDGSILRTYYERSAGNVIDAARDMLDELYRSLPRMHDGTPAVRIAHAAVTGYGESFLKQALAFDSGEVETVAHREAARTLVPDVDFVLDIGGQDMKCLYLRNGDLDNVVLNEACSSGCGALLSGMAWSMNVRLDRFIARALYARNPVDLGTRCTVFMTSRVRHAQKDGASVGDIAAGLAYSVVRNAVFKVIRARDFSSLGKRIVVQGGTFMNDSVLRAFEKLAGREVARPDIAGHMGAYGAALIARRRAGDQEVSSLLSRERMKALSLTQTTSACDKCGNRCALVSTTFVDGVQRRTFTVGNRCPRGEESERRGGPKPPDLFAYRVRRVFQMPQRRSAEAPRGRIGIMRALDMYDLFPFWATFLTELGFEVVLSDRLTGLTGRALETIPSESTCYPAKLAHAHLVNLVEQGVRLVFAPFTDAVEKGQRACPVLAGYPFVLRENVALLGDEGVELVSPALSTLFSAGRTQVAEGVAEALFEALAPQVPSLGLDEVSRALREGARAQRAFADDMCRAGDKALAIMRRKELHGVVLAGRPYHGDPAVHHAIPSLLTGCGYAVLTVDSLPSADGGESAARCGSADGEGYGRWDFAERSLAAARYAAANDDVQFVQLYSFGCGVDAAAVDRARAIVEGAGKVFTALKIDEMVDLASVRIRVRSMMAAQAERAAACGKGAQT